MGDLAGRIQSGAGLAPFHRYEAALAHATSLAPRYQSLDRALARGLAPEAPTPADRIDGVVKPAEGTVELARNIDVLADAAEPEPHRIDLRA